MSETIKIIFPANFIPERKYIIHVLFDVFLGIKMECIVSDSVNNYEIILGSDKIITIEDHFFNKIDDSTTFIDKKNIPKCLKYFDKEIQLPIIFGNSNINLKDNSVVIGIDVFASCFFMLSRWEEMVYECNDSLNRFDYKNALAVKHNFNQRAIVQEYVELLKYYLKKIGFRGKFKQHEYKFIPTHDIDYPLKWNKSSDFIKTILGDIIKRKSYNSFFKTLKSKLNNNDPYDRIEYFINLSNKYGLISRFYFLMNQNNLKKSVVEYLQRKITYIIENQHEIGLHPDFGTYDNFDKLNIEKHFIKNIIKTYPIHTRQHFLQFQIDKTPSILSKAGFKTDSSLYFKESPGFRTGSCWDYPLFDLSNRKMLDVYESTLCYMDTSVHRWNTKADAFEEIMTIVKEVKKYNGNFIFLWHNSSFDYYEWNKYNGIYEEVLIKNSILK